MSDKVFWRLIFGVLIILLAMVGFLDTSLQNYKTDNADLKRIISDQREQIVELEKSIYTVPRDPAIPVAKDCEYLDIELPKELQLYTWQCCQHFGVDYKLFISLMWQESSFNKSSFDNHYVGYVQMDPANVPFIADKLGYAIDIHNEYDNILAGVYWFSRFVEMYPDDTYMQLMCYNVGENGAQTYENKEYYNNIISYYLTI